MSTAAAPDVTLPDWAKQYEKGVPATIDLVERPLYRVLDDTATRFPEKTALRLILKTLKYGLAVQSAMTYAQLQAASDRLAAALQGLGVKPGDRVAIILPNIPQQVISYFGILKAGGVVINVNPTYTPRELLQQLGNSGAETVITLSGLCSRIDEIRGQLPLKRVILTDIVDSLPWYWKLLAARQVRASGMMADVPPAPHIHKFDALLASAPTSPTPVPFDPDGLALIQYSGGTTGVPKGAMLTHRNLTSNLQQSRVWLLDFKDGQEVVLGALPFFHVYGMTACMLLGIYTGSELIMVPDPRQTQMILEIIAQHGVSFYPGVPAMYVAINNHPRVKEYNLHSVKYCLSGGASLPIQVSTRFEELTGGSLVEGYGLSECSPVAAANPMHGVKRSGSIGLPIPNTRIEIVALHPDEQGNHPLMPLGEPGELVIYGPQVMKGYWENPEETAKSINARGGLHTGDIARMEEDGYLYIVDRKKDLIIASGYNIVPREVEEVLFMHPKVLEAIVAGVPDPRRGETVKAYLVLKPGEKATVEEIRDFCKQHLAPYKVPSAVDFRDSLPKSLVGKVLRRLLVEEEIAKLAAQEGSETKS